MQRSILFGLAALTAALASACGEVDPTKAWCRNTRTAEQCSCMKSIVSPNTWTAMSRISTALEIGGQEGYRRALATEVGADGLSMYVAETGLAEKTCLPTRAPPPQ